MADRTIAFVVDEEFHRKVKVRIAETGQTLKGYIIYLIEQDLKAAYQETKVQKREYSIEDAISKGQELEEILYQIAKNEKK